MIFASTLVLALALGSVPAAIAAPIGNRNFDVRAMRRSMESAPVEVEKRAPVMPEHHSARSYVPGGGNDPQARSTDANASNIGKREEEPRAVDEPPKTWHRRSKQPRHVRDAVPRKRATIPASTPVEARAAVDAAKVNERSHTEDHKDKESRAVNPSDSNIETREEKQPRNDTPLEELAARKAEERSEPGTPEVKGRQAGEGTNEDIARRGQLHPIAMLKRALESLD